MILAIAEFDNVYSSLNIKLVYFRGIKNIYLEYLNSQDKYF